MGLSVWQILLIVAVVVLLFGANRIPRLMKDVGSGVTAFKKGLKDEDDAEGADKDAAKPALKADPATSAAATSDKKPASKA